MGMPKDTRQQDRTQKGQGMPAPPSDKPTASRNDFNPSSFRQAESQHQSTPAPAPSSSPSESPAEDGLATGVVTSAADDAPASPQGSAANPGAPTGGTEDAPPLDSHGDVLPVGDDADGRGVLADGGEGESDDTGRGSLSGGGSLTDGGDDPAAKEAREKDRKRRKFQVKVLIRVALALLPIIAVIVAVIMLASCINSLNPFNMASTNGSASAGASASAASASSGNGGGTQGTVTSQGGNNNTLPRVSIDYKGLHEMFDTEEEDEEDSKRAGIEVANLACELALSAVNSGDPAGDLQRLGLSGRYSYGSEGRIHAHEPEYDWDSTAYIPPDPKIPKAKEWIEFEGLSKGGHTSISLPSTAGKTKDGTKTLIGVGVYADCAAMPWNVWQYFHSDLAFMDDFARYAHITVKSAEFGGRGVPATQMIGPSGEMCSNRFRFIMTDPSKTWDEQCQPGDILCNGSNPHYMLYVGNKIARKYFPGTTGIICEAGHRSQAYWGITEGASWKPDGRNWFIARYIDEGDEASNGGGGSLSDGSLSPTQRRIVEAAQSTGSPGGGLCAMWASMVYENAGLGYPGGNACDQYDWYCKSSNLSDLKPGMMVAVRQHSLTPAGSTYGHVGIYIGNGQLMDNIGYIRTISVQEWIDTYNAAAIDCTVKWGWGVSGADLSKS